MKNWSVQYAEGLKMWNIFIFIQIILLCFTFLDGSFGSWFIVLQCFCVIFVTLFTQFLKHLIWKPYPFFTLLCPLQWEPSTKVRMYFSSLGSLPMLYVWRLQAKSKTTPRPTNKLKLLKEMNGELNAKYHFNWTVMYA